MRGPARDASTGSPGRPRSASALRREPRGGRSELVERCTGPRVRRDNWAEQAAETPFRPKFKLTLDKKLLRNLTGLLTTALRVDCEMCE